MAERPLQAVPSLGTSARVALLARLSLSRAGWLGSGRPHGLLAVCGRHWPPPTRQQALASSGDNSKLTLSRAADTATLVDAVSLLAILLSILPSRQPFELLRSHGACTLKEASLQSCRCCCKARQRSSQLCIILWRWRAVSSCSVASWHALNVTREVVGQICVSTEKVRLGHRLQW